VIAAGELGITSIAVDATAIYWVKSGSPFIRAALLQPNAIASDLCDTAGAPVSVAAGGKNVFWADPTNGKLGSVPRADCSKPLTSSRPTPRDIVVGGTTSFFLQGDPGDAGTDAGANTAIGWTDSATMTSVNVHATVNPTDVTTDGTNAYCVTDACEVYALAVATSSPKKLGQVGTECRAITLGGSLVYWTGAGAVYSVTTVGNLPTAIASGEKAPGPIAADVKGVYWLNMGTGELRTLVNNKATTIASGDLQDTAPAGFHGIALDAKYIYRVSYQDGVIKRTLR